MKKLMKILLPVTLMMFLPAVMIAQSAVTNTISFDMDDINELFMPPDLRVDMKFVDDDYTGILEAMSAAKLHLKIMNEGGTADNVKVSITPERNYKGLHLNKTVFTTRVSKDSFVELDVPFSADLNVETSNDVRFNIKISEPYGYDINAVLEFPTLEYQKAALKMNGVSIVDAGKGLKAYNGNPDGKLQRGDVVQATVLLQNVGVGVAENVTYTITSSDSNVYLMTDSGMAKTISGSLSDLASADAKEISFRLSANHNYINRGEYLPIYLTVKEEKGFGNIVSQNIPIPFDATPVKPEMMTVVADLDKVIANLGPGGRITSDDGRVNPNLSSPSIRNISVAPVGENLYSNAIAIVIGTEKYSDSSIPMAPYAARDAEVMAEYFKTSLGVQNVQLLTDEKVTAMELNTMFDSQRGKLSRMIQYGQTDVFVYYSGHGVPLPDGSDVMLIPYDVEKAWINDYGFSLNRMYDNLASLNAKSVTVILDACFSGGSRPSDLHKSESIANQKLVMPDMNAMEQPWLDNPNFRVFTSSRGDQTSLGYDLSRSGLFTYYIACGLQGDADLNADQKITMAELVEFVTSNVDKESAGTQTPQFYGNQDFVIEKL
ncbi:MAG: caspase family protein [Bacteroidales bacterium]|nr:caspase family protein [Bacteroidales bacterium]